MKKILAFVLGLIISLWSQVAFCDTSTITIYGKEIIVTATRDRQETRKIPADVVVITASEIKKSGASSLVDVLEEQTGIHFRSFSGNASQAEITMRGFGENSSGRVLVLLDGRRLNRPDMAGINWLSIPLSDVERVEIVRGANSVLYGDNALAGVINIITRKEVGRPGVDILGMAGEVNDLRLSLGGSKTRFSYALNLERQETDGYRDRTSFSCQAAGLNLGYDFNDYLSSSLNISFDKVKYQMPGHLTRTQMDQDRKQASNQSDDAEEEYQNVNLGLETILDDFGQFDINFLYGKKEIETNMDSWFSWTNPTIATFGLTPEYILEREILTRTNKLILGLDYYEEDLDIDNFTDRSRETKSSRAEIEKNSSGWYISDEFGLLERLILSAGAREEKATIKAKSMTAQGIENFNGKKEHNGQAFNIGLTSLIGERSKIFARYATLYRYPFTDEQASYWGWRDDKFLHDIEAEKGKDYEVGADLYPLKDLRVGLTLFRIDMEDEIAFNAATFRNENLDETRHQGLELKASYRLEEKARIHCNYTYAEAEFTKGVNDGKRLPLVPEQKATLRIEVSMPHNFSLSGNISYTSDCYLGGDYDNNAEKLSDYTLVDLFLHYKVQRDGARYRAFIGAENIFNEKYCSTGYEGWVIGYYPSPERTIKAGLSFML